MFQKTDHLRRGGAGSVRGARTIAASTTLLAALALSGCASLPDFGVFAREPVRTDRFVVPDENTDVVGLVQVVIARDEDTLPDFARRYGLGHDEIVAANPDVDPWLPGKGTRVVLPTQFVLPDAPRDGLVVNLASLRLFYYPKPEEGEPQTVVTHPIGIGREGWRTPLGRMRITEKIENPTWTPPASVRREHAAKGDHLPGVVPAGPDNPLGAYAMRLGRPSYLLHGTNKPFGVGMRVSHGCVRLYPEDIAELFPEIPVGTNVYIVSQPYLAGTKNGELSWRPMSHCRRRPNVGKAASSRCKRPWRRRLGMIPRRWTGRRPRRLPARRAESRSRSPRGARISTRWSLAHRECRAYRNGRTARERIADPASDERRAGRRSRASRSARRGTASARIAG